MRLGLVLLVRDVPRAAAFYRDGLGMRLLLCTERWAELRAPDGGMRVALQHSEAPADGTDADAAAGSDQGDMRAAGNNLLKGADTAVPPPRSFLSVASDDVAGWLPRLLQLGASMEGPLVHLGTGKVAVLRCPSGHLLRLVEEEQAAAEDEAALGRAQ